MNLAKITTFFFAICVLTLCSCGSLRTGEIQLQSIPPDSSPIEQLIVDRRAGDPPTGIWCITKDILPSEIGVEDVIVKEPQRWKAGSTVRVCFINGAGTQLAQIVYDALEEWARRANVRFTYSSAYVKSNDRSHLHVPTSDIRVRFTQSGGNWSLVGRSPRMGGKYRIKITPDGVELTDPPPNFYTMSFTATRRGFDWTVPRSTARHEVGHALGLRHEHQHPNANIQWNREVVYNDMKRYGWSRADVDHNILDVADRRRHNFGAFDPDSIMIYSIPARWTRDGFSVRRKAVLSSGDKAGIRQHYPRR